MATNLSGDGALSKDRATYPENMMFGFASLYFEALIAMSRLLR